MPQSSKEIIRRIKSITNTKKVTKAMELVSGAKMKKSVEATLASRFYAKYSWEILTNLAATAETIKHPLLSARKVRRVCIVLISSDKGLCGNYNSAVIKKIIEQLKSPQNLMINRVLERKVISDAEAKDLQIDFVCIGRKGAEIMRKLNKNVAEVFTGLADRPKLRDLKPIAQLLMDQYKKGIYDKVAVAYTDYYSAVKHNPKIRQLLPVSRIDLEKVLKDLETEYSRYKNEDQKSNGANYEYIFEPDKKRLLGAILPKLVEMQIYQMVMESSASENSARMLAMKNASDAATEMIGELTLMYNKARQAAITQEIAEISSGKAALEQ